MTPKQKNLAMRIEAERLDRRNVSMGWQTSGAQADYVRGLMIRKAVAEKSKELVPTTAKPANPADPYAHLKAAQAAGKIIEARERNGPGAKWLDIRANFDSDVLEYRIKPD